ncbi:MAG: thioredoxin [Planctomycetota bacterium]
MASDTLIEFTDANFKAEALDADVPVLVDFWAEWCMPCKMLAPVIEKVAASYGDKVKAGKLDTDANRETAVEYGISSIPTVILFHKGEPVKTIVGLQPEAAYTAEIDALLG